LTINPSNEKVRAYLGELERQYRDFLIRKNVADAAAMLNEAKAHAERNDTSTAIQLARQALEKNQNFEEAWLLIGRISTNIDQQIAAFEKALEQNPSNRETAAAFERLRRRKADPIGEAVRLEQAGKFEEALSLYEAIAGKARNSREFDHIYKQIVRLEGLQNEKIRYVTPASSIARLTFVWPVLYFSLALIQVGLNPFAHPALYLWLGLPWVILGSFLLSLAEVGSEHIVWQRIFSEQGGASKFARSVAAAVGWSLVIVPHVLMLLDSINRLQNFEIPPIPF
jgi:tetratricopeptide (TPR) repeat protein